MTNLTHTQRIEKHLISELKRCWLDFEQKKELFEIEKAERIAVLKNKMMSELEDYWHAPVRDAEKIGFHALYCLDRIKEEEESEFKND